MKIVFNTDQIHLHGGIEKVMATKVNYWASLPEVEVYIVTVEQHGKMPCYPLDSRVKLIDLGVNYNRSRSYFSIENCKKAVQHFKKQKALFKTLAPDVIISPNFNFDHYWLPFIKGKTKLIKERHSSRYFEEAQRANKSLLSRIKFKFNDWIDAKYDAIVVLNEDEKKYVRSNNAVVIPNPITIPAAKAALTKKQIIAAGRISPVKGFEDLILAWKQIFQQFPDWQLHIYGDDYLGTKDKLISLVKANGLSDVVLFKGTVADIPAEMLEYSGYALSSDTECFPTVLLEALSVGLPIVSYDCPNGPRHIVTHGEDGFLAEYKKPESLANYLLKLIQDDKLRSEMGSKAKENSARFTQDRIMSKWAEILK